VTEPRVRALPRRGPQMGAEGRPPLRGNGSAPADGDAAGSGRHSWPRSQRDLTRDALSQQQPLAVSVTIPDGAVIVNNVIEPAPVTIDDAPRAITVKRDREDRRCRGRGRMTCRQMPQGPSESVGGSAAVPCPAGPTVPPERILRGGSSHGCKGGGRVLGTDTQALRSSSASPAARVAS
jgi:hypothetical protein